MGAIQFNYSCNISCKRVEILKIFPSYPPPPNNAVLLSPTLFFFALANIEGGWGWGGGGGEM